MRWDHDLVGHRFVDQDPTHDHQQDADLVHQDERQDHQGEAHCDQGWTTKSDPYGPKRRDEARHLGEDRANQDPVGDAPAAAERDCRLAAVEWCDHPQVRCADRSTAAFPAVARVCQASWVDGLQEDDW